MRTILFCFVAAMVCGRLAYGEERVWTISYTTQAELVEVRGGTVFLKAGDAVQSVSLEQLSDSDRQYVASLPLAPVAQSVASDQPAGNEKLPVPGAETGATVATSAVEPASFSAPPEGPALLAPTQTQGGERSMLVSPPRVVTQMQADENGNSVMPMPAMAPNAANQGNAQNRQNQIGPNGGRLMAGQQNQGNGANQKRSRDDGRPGLFGGRQRRLLGDRN